MEYIKKPVKIEAFKLFTDDEPDWFKDAKEKGIVTYNHNSKDESQSYYSIKTLEGIMHAKNNDYIIKGVKGELYPCREDIFLETYELNQNSNSVDFIKQTSIKSIFNKNKELIQTIDAKILELAEQGHSSFHFLLVEGKGRGVFLEELSNLDDDIIKQLEFYYENLGFEIYIQKTVFIMFIK